MKKEEIISVLNQLDDWSFGYCSTPEEAAEEIISSSQEKTPKVGNNEKAKEVCCKTCAHYYVQSGGCFGCTAFNNHEPTG